MTPSYPPLAGPISCGVAGMSRAVASTPSSQIRNGSGSGLVGESL